MEPAVRVENRRVYPDMGFAGIVRQNAKTAGLIRQVEDVNLGTRVKSVYLDFSALGVPTNGTDFYFPADLELNGNNARIYGIEIIDNTSNGSLPPRGQVDNLAASVLSAGIFYAANNEEQLFSIPLSSLNRRLNNGRTCQVLMTTQVWSTCYVSFVNVGSLAATNGIWFNVYYTPVNDL